MYRAIQQGDNTYTIPDVEVFLPYADEKIDPPIMNAEDLNLFVMNHEKQKADAAKKFGADKTYLPRVHVAHHEEGSVTNNVGAGFVDNLRVQNGILFADLVKVPANVIDDIEQGKYPYRSVEFVGDMPEVRIIGLALLESREPYHKLPIMDGIQRESTSTFTANEPVRIFQNLRNLVDVKKYQKENELDIASYAKKYGCSEDELTQKLQKFMDDEFAEKMQDDEDAEKMQDEDEVQEMEDADDVEMMEDDEELAAMMQDGEDDDDVEMFNNFYKGLDMVTDNIGWDPSKSSSSHGYYEKDPTLQSEAQWRSVGGNRKIASLAEEGKTIDRRHGGDAKLKRLAKLARKNPEKYLAKYRAATSSYQAKKEARMFQQQVVKTLKAMQAEIFQLRQEKINSEVDEDLREVCEEKGLDYKAESKMVRKFQKAQDKKDYIKHLKARPVVQQFQGTSPNHTGLPSLPATRMSTELANKFQNESPKIQTLAKRLEVAYNNTVQSLSRKQAQKFQMHWKNAEDYVTYHVEKEKKSPGFCEKERVFA